MQAKIQRKKQRKIREKSEIKKASSKQAFRQDHRQDLRAIIWNAILAVIWRCVSGTRVAGSGGVAVALVEKWIIPKLRWEMRVKWVYLSPSDAKDSVNCFLRA